MLRGVDVSSYQGDPMSTGGWPECDFVIVKVSQGTGYVNPCWPGQYGQARDAGKLLGLYHYASGGDPVAEADFFLNNAGGSVSGSLLALDWEAGQNGAWGNGHWCDGFVDRVHDRTGQYPTIYVQASAIGQVIHLRDRCRLWVAGYTNSSYQNGWYDSSCPYDTGGWPVFMWQFTSVGGDRSNCYINDRNEWAAGVAPQDNGDVPMTECVIIMDDAHDGFGAGSALYWSPQTSVIAMTNGDQYKMLNEIHNQTNGKNIPVVHSKSTSPWIRRLRDTSVESGWSIMCHNKNDIINAINNRKPQPVDPAVVKDAVMKAVRESMGDAVRQAVVDGIREGVKQVRVETTLSAK